MKILVVDDSAVMRKVLIDALAKVGYTDVGQAADGEEAVAAVMSEEYGLVLLDWNMPSMSGLDVLKAIRADGDSIPIIMVTTEAEKTRVIDAIKAGANSYIIKPFKPETISEKVQDVLQRASE